jgi:hypothetical protein
LQNQDIDINSVEEIVIVVPEDAMQDGELEIDLDELGIDLESLGEDVNIVIQVEGADEEDEDFMLDDDEMIEPNGWYFDDDPYEIVYDEFPDFD